MTSYDSHGAWVGSWATGANEPAKTPDLSAWFDNRYNVNGSGLAAWNCRICGAAVFTYPGTLSQRHIEWHESLPPYRRDDDESLTPEFAGYERGWDAARDAVLAMVAETEIPSRYADCAAGIFWAVDRINETLAKVGGKP